MHRWKKQGLAAAVVIAAGVAFAGARESVETAPSFETAAVRLRIDVSERMLYVEQNGETIESYGVAVGTKSHPTPRGSFAVRRVIWNPRWVPPDEKWAAKKIPRGPGDPKNPMGRVKIFFLEPDYYIHGTNDPGSIGSAASHGCVRMRNTDIIALGKMLVDKGDAPVEPGLIRRLINTVTQTREVRLRQSIPLKVQT